MVDPHQTPQRQCTPVGNCEETNHPPRSRFVEEYPEIIRGNFRLAVGYPQTRSEGLFPKPEILFLGRLNIPRQLPFVPGATCPHAARIPVRIDFCCPHVWLSA